MERHVPTRIVHIIIDAESVRRIVASRLRRSGYRVIGWTGACDFLDRWPKVPDGCIILDLRMPGMDGLEAQCELRRLGCSLPVVMVTGDGAVSSAVQAMRNGAIDFVEEPLEHQRLIEALERAFDRLESAYEIEAQAADAKIRLALLTPREREVLHRLAQGLPNKTIGHDLGISPRTVEVHRANLMMKLRARSFSEALRFAFAAGLGLPGRPRPRRGRARSIGRAPA
jgi:two-component system response regulator FixJ